ncbi:MAG: cysteine desulfurase [Pirellula sp.]|jgi:cysteine desulfurase/selenocysteine lyase|nr:cysteine desulfurase [Pirellula sp.]
MAFSYPEKSSVDIDAMDQQASLVESPAIVDNNLPDFSHNAPRPETFEDVSSNEVTRRLLDLASQLKRPTPSSSAAVNSRVFGITPNREQFDSIDSQSSFLPTRTGYPPVPHAESPGSVGHYQPMPTELKSDAGQASEPDLSKLPTTGQSDLPAPVLAAMLRAASPNSLPMTPAAQAKSAVDKLRQPRSLQSLLGKESAPAMDINPDHAVSKLPNHLSRTSVPNSFSKGPESPFTAKPYRPAGYRPVDVESIRGDFPALHQTVNGHPLVWFDNAATTHKPNSVIDAMSSFYRKDYSNIHRAAHTLAARATDHYESARETVQRFIRADSSKDIVFVRGTTEGMNFLANVCQPFLKDGDEILLSELEHHANIVPWQLLAKRINAKIRVIPFDDNGEIMLDEYRRLLSPKTKIVSVSHASNTLGTVLPVEDMSAMAHKRGARFIVDGAQSIAHMPINVSEIGCDFFVFSGHKIFAPTGIGAVYVHPDLQDMLPPWQGGGNMIQRVTFQETTYSDAPAKFEAGTPSIGDAVGLRAALEYLEQFDPHALLHYEHSLLEHAQHGLSRIKGVTIYGHAKEKVGLVSFTLDRYSTEAVGKELNRHGIAVRTGHHCAQPSLRHFGLETTVRPSFALYNTHEEIDRMLSVIHQLARKV